MGQSEGKKDKTDRATGVGRRTREETIKWSSEIPDRGETSDLPGLPWGVIITDRGGGRGAYFQSKTVNQRLYK